MVTFRFLDIRNKMKRTRIKFCGITRVEDMQQAISLGVDAVGLVFAKNSLRAVNVQQACALIDHSGPFVSCVGLFMDQDASTINDIINQVPLDMLQFHGQEPASFCTSFGMPYLKSVAMGCTESTATNAESCLGLQPEYYSEEYSSASALLLDSNDIGKPGGSGKTFNWNSVFEFNRPIIIAGGLNAENIASCIEQLQPYAVDVSSGIETEKGIKDMNKMKDFVKSVRMANEC